MHKIFNPGYESGIDKLEFEKIITVLRWKGDQSLGVLGVG